MKFFLIFPFVSDNGGFYYWHIKSGTIQREMPIWPKELKTPVLPTSPQLMIPNDSNNSIFSVAYNSLFNYNNEQTNGNHISNNNLNANNQQSHASSTSSTTVARSNSSTALDIENEKKHKKDLEYK